MKLSPRTFKIQWDLHAWAGVVASLLLFVIFYAGIFALYHPAFSRWQGPASDRATLVAEPSHVSYDGVLSQIEQSLTIPRGASILLRLALGPEVEPGTSTVSVYHDPTKLQRDFPFDNISGEMHAASVEHSRLADELYVLHFFYQLPWGVELSGLTALGLFVAVISGLVIHWKDLLRQIWQFRPLQRLRVSASDAHKVLGVFGLPFATMFAWSGALLGLYSLLALPLQYGAFGGDASALDAARGDVAQAPVEGERAASRLPLDELVTRGTSAAAAHFAGAVPLRVERLDIENYGNEGARFQVSFVTPGFQKARSVVLAPDGRVVRIDGDTSAPAEAVDRVLFDLHYARFGGELVKACYALLALGVCVVLVTGNLVWLERRDRARSRLGNRLLERLTIGVCFGLVASTGVYCAANRWLPAGIARRSDIEVALWLGAWTSSAVAVFFRWPPRRWAGLLCSAAALAFAAALVGDVVTHPLQVHAAWSGRAAPLLAAELVLGALGALSAGLARGLLRSPAGSPKREPSTAAQHSTTHPATTR